MFLLVAAAAAATASATPRPAPPEASPAPVAVEAVATVRIVSGVRLRFDADVNPGAPPAHDSKVRSDGKDLPARLIEFE